MSEIHEYHQSLMADIRREADASGVLMVEAFFDEMTARLTEAGELEAADRAFYQSGEGAQRLRIDGYAGDPRDSDGVLGLVVCDFVDSDELQTIGKVDVPPILNPVSYTHLDVYKRQVHNSNCLRPSAATSWQQASLRTPRLRHLNEPSVAPSVGTTCYEEEDLKRWRKKRRRA